MTNNRWFEVNITDGLDKYYEKSTIPRIYTDFEGTGGAPLDIGERYIYPHLHIKRNLDSSFKLLLKYS